MDFTSARLPLDRFDREFCCLALDPERDDVDREREFPERAFERVVRDPVEPDRELRPRPEDDVARVRDPELLRLLLDVLVDAARRPLEALREDDALRLRFAGARRSLPERRVS